MGVALVKDTGSDPRAALRAAIAEAAKANDRIERHRQAIARARDMVAAAEAKVAAAGEILERSREDHAEALVAAAAEGGTPKANGQMRSARMALADSEDEAQSARLALEHLEVGGEALGADSPQPENQILIEISKVIAPIAEQILAQLRQKESEVLMLSRVLGVLLEDAAIPPVFSRQIQQMNAKDARMRPLAGLREDVYGSNKSGEALARVEQMRVEQAARAEQAAAEWRKWRECLRRDPAASMPELPT